MHLTFHNDVPTQTTTITRHMATSKTWYVLSQWLGGDWALHFLFMPVNHNNVQCFLVYSTEVGLG